MAHKMGTLVPVVPCAGFDFLELCLVELVVSPYFGRRRLDNEARIAYIVLY